MLFNSISFLIFLPIVFTLYWILNKNYKWQNILLLLSSYYFYMCWDWRFGFLLLFSTLLDYFTGLKMANSKNDKLRKFWLTLSIVINLGFLGFFKYYNFFVESFTDFFKGFGLNMDPWVLHIVLPVGISFYTFHGLSYVIDIYKRKIPAEYNFVDYAVFVSFFPLLVAGPIERATHLLPQIQRKRIFNYDQAVDGMRQILWGFFKKVVIADNCATFANHVFANADHSSGSTLFLGAVFFTFQIYGDFSGYSDIALGVARLFGIELLKNFAYPYFSRDVAEFWRRWHISLSTWFRDYLYIPLGGSKGGTWMRIRNTFIIFVVSGFWHGANWTFIMWGVLNALFIMPSIILKTNRKNMEVVALNRLIPSYKDALQIFTTFLLTVLAWIFFRAQSISKAFAYIKGIFTKSFFTFPDFNKEALGVLIIIAFFMSVEWMGKDYNYALENLLIPHQNTSAKRARFLSIARWVFYAFIIMLIGLFIQTKETPFIYFQF
ncbi:MBOAT family O-acyltransferase [Riemerella columbipharyngis]|uniref:D-alanyl-lipoteichoic acid acyltransferase DltB, MBOAT superfamily n=1 Tax=Riemerella columbipharyngis TaxID=1071918 RepID=A0A1G7EC41_9FLAO|nr:MBOAT family O-acyltransferase [Riemerella columbipharyngis]SDE61210.1 D-alanyl-lipoteichoic acid acyltransferase DltB, MBOAT superfamily [Riemerella columbipharyngis]